MSPRIIAIRVIILLRAPPYAAEEIEWTPWLSEPDVGELADARFAREIDAAIDARRFTLRASEPCSRHTEPPPQRVALA